MVPVDQKWGWADPFGSTLPWRRPLWQWLDLALEVARPCLVMEFVQDMRVCLAALEVMLQKRATRGNTLEQAQHRTQRTQRGARPTETATELGGCSGRRSPGRAAAERVHVAAHSVQNATGRLHIRKHPLLARQRTHIKLVARKCTHQISVFTPK